MYGGGRKRSFTTRQGYFVGNPLVYTMVKLADKTIIGNGYLKLHWSWSVCNNTRSYQITLDCYISFIRIKSLLLYSQLFNRISITMRKHLILEKITICNALIDTCSWILIHLSLKAFTPRELFITQGISNLAVYCFSNMVSSNRKYELSSIVKG